MVAVRVIEIGARARAALTRTPQYEVLMHFSRGEVWRTRAGEIVWVDEDPDAFSEMGIRPNVGRTLQSAPRAGLRTRPTFFDAALESAITAFLSTLAPHHLLGLGPGLTPAGDDFLGGFLAVRHRLGHRDIIDTAATHEISRARLAMHMRGEGTRAEVRFLRALLAGEDTTDAAERLRRLGATSGADFIRGAVAAWERR